MSTFRAVFQHFQKKKYKKLLTISIRVCNKDVAEYLTQETFLRFFESHYQEKGREMNYLYTIAKNLCINEIKNNVLTLQNEEIAGSKKAENSKKIVMIIDDVTLQLLS